jgi:SAM-dependent methyltransferase
VPRNDAKSFWDARAEESALYFVDNRLAYDDPDEQAFWDGAEETVDALLGHLDARVRPTDTVVDIGCGVGRLTRVLAARAERVVGIDVSPRMLELARRHNASLTNVEWVEGDGRSLQPIASASADACVSHVVFQHIPDAEITYGYVREIGRVLRPAGGPPSRCPPTPRARAEPVAARPAARGARPRPAGSGAPELARLRRRRRPPALGRRRRRMDVELVVGEGTQFCLVRTRRR